LQWPAAQTGRHGHDRQQADEKQPDAALAAFGRAATVTAAASAQTP
jgi:hypothetical protein